jgi:hypothetical protein
MNRRHNTQSPEQLKALPVKHKTSDMTPTEMRILASTLFGRPIADVAFLAQDEDGSLCLTGSDIAGIPRLLEASLDIFEKAFPQEGNPQ